MVGVVGPFSVLPLVAHVASEVENQVDDDNNDGDGDSDSGHLRPGDSPRLLPLGLLSGAVLNQPAHRQVGLVRPHFHIVNLVGESIGGRFEQLFELVDLLVHRRFRLVDGLLVGLILLCAASF